MLFKNFFLKILNPMLFVVVVFQLSVGFGHSFVGREWFGPLHKNGAIAVAVLAFIHLVLNFGWIKASYFKKTVKKETPTS